MRDLIATDMSGPMLHQAEAKLRGHSNVRFQQQDAYKTSFDESTFDAVLSGAAGVRFISESARSAC